MLWSKLFIPTLREDPGQVESESHRLLMRAGFIRPLGAGIYSLLPLAYRVRTKIMDVIRQEMNAIDGQEFLLPALHPEDVWQESGRLDTMGEIIFRLKDRKRSGYVLGVTHEEIFTTIARGHLNSYRQLPQTWYQFQTKFRDEARPRGGLLRVREFTMKDSYSFDLDQAGLDTSFENHRQAYCNIFSRVGLRYMPVEASSGAMGGSHSVEFMVATQAGEDTVIACDSCGYMANLEKAQAKAKIDTNKHSGDSTGKPAIEKFYTPNIKTIEALAKFEGGASAENQIKTLVWEVESKLWLILMRGDDELNIAKLEGLAGTNQIRPADETMIFEALGAHPGSLGAVNVSVKDNKKIARIIADEMLQDACDMTTGANVDDYHYRNVQVGRDIQPDQYHDLRSARAGDKCGKCGNPVSISKALEIGHIFKLGTKYSVSMGATVLTSDGQSVPIIMGSYGIGVERLMAAIAETSFDEKGLIWPAIVAPYTVAIVPVNMQDEAQKTTAFKLYEELKAKGIDVVLDDRDERAGVKFADTELVGIPWRITVGKKIGDGLVELVERNGRKNQDVKADEVVDLVVARLGKA
jgi:prolyl-tRNA synthetase